MVDLVSATMTVYLAVALIILGVSLLRPPFKRLKILHSIKYQMILFLAVWLLSELLDKFTLATDFKAQSGTFHFAAMLIFAAFTVYYTTRIVKVIP